MRLAYLDPGSGSLILQAVVAGFAGALVAVRIGWRRIVNRIRRRPSDQE